MDAKKIDNNFSRMIAALTAFLPRGTSFTFRSQEGPHAIIKVAGLPVRARWVAAGWPAQINEILKGPKPDIVVAPHLSPGARELLNRHSIGWLDESGAAEFVLGTIVVSRTGIQSKKRQPLKSERWSPSLLATAEALLCKTNATVDEIGKVTSLSSGACTKALRELAESGLLISDAARGRNSARRVMDENKLLEAYATAVAASSRKNAPELAVGGAWRDLLEGLTATGTHWNELKVSWAMTGAAAAEVLAPLMTTIGSAVVYVAASSLVELEAVARRAGLKPIEGGRLTLKPFPTTTSQILATVVDGLRVAPWPRVYADLRMTGVRGEDAAEHLREVIYGR